MTFRAAFNAFISIWQQLGAISQRLHWTILAVSTRALRTILLCYNLYCSLVSRVRWDETERNKAIESFDEICDTTDGYLNRDSSQRICHSFRFGYSFYKSSEAVVPRRSRKRGCPSQGHIRATVLDTNTISFIGDTQISVNAAECLMSRHRKTKSHL